MSSSDLKPRTPEALRAALTAERSRGFPLPLPFHIDSLALTPSGLTFTSTLASLSRERLQLNSGSLLETACSRAEKSSSDAMRPSSGAPSSLALLEDLHGPGAGEPRVAGGVVEEIGGAVGRNLDGPRVRRYRHDVDPALADPRHAVPIGQELALVANDAGSGQPSCL